MIKNRKNIQGRFLVSFLLRKDFYMLSPISYWPVTVIHLSDINYAPKQTNKSIKSASTIIVVKGIQLLMLIACVVGIPLFMIKNNNQT